MEKPSSSCPDRPQGRKRPYGFCFRLLIVLGGILAFTGCTETQVNVRFAGLTSGTASLDYVLGWELVGGETGPAKASLPLPATRESWSALAATVANLTLETLTVEDLPEGQRFRLQFRFASLRALEGLAIALGHRLTVLENSGAYTWSFLPAALQTTGWTQDLRNLFTTGYAGRQVRWEISLPREARSLSEGTLSPDRRTVSLVKTLGNYVDRPPPEWRIQW